MDIPGNRYVNNFISYVRPVHVAYVVIGQADDSALVKTPAVALVRLELGPALLAHLPYPVQRGECLENGVLRSLSLGGEK